MGKQVYANDRAISCKSGSGKVMAAFPDVCLTPPAPPAGPLPIPYPLFSFAKDTTAGSKNVKIGGKEVMLKDKSYYKKCTGDEAATKAQGMGVTTHTIQGKVYFISWSMDVMMESQNVVRHLDMTTSNHASPMANDPTSVPGLEEQTIAEECQKLAARMPDLEDYTRSEWDNPNQDVASSLGQFVPDSGPTGRPIPGSSIIGESKIRRGGRYQGRPEPKKYKNFGPGVANNPAATNVKTCEGKPFQYEAARHGGHAEAKVIEKAFAEYASPDTGRPKGKLYVKIKGSWDTAKRRRENCPNCKRLRDEVNRNSNGEKCDDFEIIFCDDLPGNSDGEG